MDKGPSEAFSGDIDKAEDTKDVPVVHLFGRPVKRSTLINLSGFTCLATLMTFGFTMSFLRSYNRALSMAAEEEDWVEAKKTDFEAVKEAARNRVIARQLAWKALAGGTAIAVVGTSIIGFGVWKFLRHKGHVAEYHKPDPEGRTWDDYVQMINSEREK